MYLSQRLMGHGNGCILLLNNIIKIITGTWYGGNDVIIVAYNHKLLQSN